MIIYEKKSIILVKEIQNNTKIYPYEKPQDEHHNHTTVLHHIYPNQFNVAEETFIVHSSNIDSLSPDWIGQLRLT